MAKRLIGSDTAIGSTTNTEPVIRNDLKGVIGDRTTEVNILTSPGQLKEGAFIAELNNKKRRIDGIIKGTSLSNYYPFQNSEILDSFRTQNIKPSVDEALPNTREAANEKHIINRLIKPVCETLDIGKYELTILYKNNDHNLDTMCIQNTMYQMNALKEVTPAQWNYFMFEYQYALFDKDPEKFLKLSPEEIWESFSFEGVVEFEEMANGAESYITSGYNYRSTDIPYREAGGNKLCTITAKGPQFVFNYWGENIKQGYDAYFVLKKCEIPADYYYMLSNKSNVTALTGYKRINNKVSLQKFRPYQLCPFCLPGKLTVPREFKYYFDEEDNKRRDGLIIKIGTFFSVPINHVYKENTNFNPPPVILKDLSPKIKPYRDANEGARKEETMLAKLIINCHDGMKDF